MRVFTRELLKLFIIHYDSFDTGAVNFLLYLYVLFTLFICFWLTHFFTNLPLLDLTRWLKSKIKIHYNILIILYFILVPVLQIEPLTFYSIWIILSSFFLFIDYYFWIFFAIPYFVCKFIMFNARRDKIWAVDIYVIYLNGWLWIYRNIDYLHVIYVFMFIDMVFVFYMYELLEIGVKIIKKI